MLVSLPYGHAAGCILRVVIGFLRPNIQHETDGQEVKVRKAEPDLQAPEQEQRGRYFPAARARFF